MSGISLEEFKQVLEKGLPENQKIIDVRHKDEFQIAHIQGAENIEHHLILNHLDILKNLDKIYFYCTAGKRCKLACEMLEKQGLDPKKFIYVTGLSKDWKQVGLPVINGKISNTFHSKTTISHDKSA